MKKAVLTLFLVIGSQIAQAEKVTPLIQKDLSNISGKEGLMITVDIAPGETVPKHRHNSNVFAYVLSGTIVTQVQGQAPKTLHAGESFFEAPSDIHLDSRNPSKTEPTKLLVFFVKDKGAPPTIYLKSHGASH